MCIKEYDDAVEALDAARAALAAVTGSVGQVEGDVSVLKRPREDPDPAKGDSSATASGNVVLGLILICLVIKCYLIIMLYTSVMHFQHNRDIFFLKHQILKEVIVQISA